jgi:hypothetical protein
VENRHYIARSRIGLAGVCGICYWCGMRILQSLMVVVCVLLAVIVWQLHGLRPVRQAEVQSLIDAGQSKQAWELMQHAPVVNVGHSGGAVDVRITE